MISNSESVSSHKPFCISEVSLVLDSISEPTVKMVCLSKALPNELLPEPVSFPTK